MNLAFAKLDHEDLSPEEQDSLWQKAEAFMKQFFSNWSLIGIRTLQLHEEVLKPALEVLPGHSLLEVGVGAGYHLPSYASLDYHAVDISSMYLEIARNIAWIARLDDKNIVERKPSKPLPFPNASMDRVLSVCTLHEIASEAGTASGLEAELTEMDRVLKAHGRIIIAERMTALAESPAAVASLKLEQQLVPAWLGSRGYAVKTATVKATYLGESLTQQPQFTFLTIIASR